MNPSEYAEFLGFLRQSLTVGLKTDAAASAGTTRALTARPVLYVPAGDPRCAEIIAAHKGALDARVLPAKPEDRDPHAMLWLPNSYIMAGPQRYREQYYWDTRFAVKGLLALGETALAFGMVRNLLYEIEHYGVALNANRCWSLEVPRSQPPFLSTMVLELADTFGPARAPVPERLAWLREAYPYLEKTYEFWKKNRFSALTGLFHYDAAGPGSETPCPELDRAKSRISQKSTHYEDALAYFRALPEADEDRAKFYDAEKDALRGIFYRNDRAMREAGCDPSDRFGPFSCRASAFDPVCLNSLLALHCADTAKICTALGLAANAARWQQEADRLKEIINDALWDETGGVYVDYDRERGRRSDFLCLTTAFPLFAGLAPPERAARVLQNILGRFLAEKSLRLSLRRTGKRWDDCDMLPYVAVAVEGLLRCGWPEDAKKISSLRAHTLFDIWRQHGVVPEKFDPDTGMIDMDRLLLQSGGFNDGDRKNDPAFAWNAAETLWAEKRFGPGLGVTGPAIPAAPARQAIPAAPAALPPWNDKAPGALPPSKNEALKAPTADPAAPELLSGLTRKKYAALRDSVFREIFTKTPKPGPCKAVFTGGLSGLGKTTMVAAALKPLADGVIDANDLRNYHPRYAEYINEYSSEMARDLTRDFCDLLAVDLQNDAVAQGRGFIREGTLQLPGSCIPEALQAAERGHDVVLVVLASQFGDEELGRHLRHWEMRGDKERLALTQPEQARTAYVREIEHTYDDARAQTGIFLTLARVEEGLKRHTANAGRGTAHKVIVLGPDASVKYVNGFKDPLNLEEAWQVCALEYDRPRTVGEAARLTARIRRTRALMHNFVATDKEWLTFQRLVDNRLAAALPGAETGRPQRDLARQDAAITSRFDPPAVWTEKTVALLHNLIRGV